MTLNKSFLGCGDYFRDYDHRFIGVTKQPLCNKLQKALLKYFNILNEKSLTTFTGWFL